MKAIKMAPEGAILETFLEVRLELVSYCEVVTKAC